MSVLIGLQVLLKWYSWVTLWYISEDILVTRYKKRGCFCFQVQPLIKTQLRLCSYCITDRCIIVIVCDYGFWISVRPQRGPRSIIFQSNSLQPHQQTMLVPKINIPILAIVSFNLLPFLVSTLRGYSASGSIPISHPHRTGLPFQNTTHSLNV